MKVGGGSLNRNWPIVPLGKVVKHRKEFIQIDDLEVYKRCRVQLHAQGVVLRDAVLGSEIKTKKQQVCRSGEFLVAEIDAKLGGFGIVPDDLDGAIVSSHYFLFSLDEHQIYRRYLDYYIRTRAFCEQVQAQGSTNYAAIRPSNVLAYTIPLPSMSEQHRVVTRIDEVTLKVQEAKKLREVAEAETKALVSAASYLVFRPARQNEVMPLESVCTAIIDNLHSNPIYSDTGIPCVRSPDVGRGKLRLETALKTSEEEYKRRTVRGEPITDDIVLVREGGGTGKAAIVEGGQRFSLGQRVMMLRPNKEVIEPKFLLYQLLSPTIYEEQILPRCKGSASPHLNIGALRKFDFYLPPMSEQKQIVSYLDTLQAKIEVIRQMQEGTGAELDAMFPSVLDRAFKGEL